MVRYSLICLIICFGSIFSMGQNKDYPSLKAKKIYRTYKKKEGFKEAKIPRFLIAAARLVVKNPEANTIMKTIQKARVISRLDRGEGLNKQYFADMNNSISTTLYHSANSGQKNFKVNVREKGNKVKEMAIVTKAGPTLHYIFLKGNMKKDEAEKFLKNINKAGLNIDKAKDRLFEGIDKLLEKRNGSRQG